MDLNNLRETMGTLPSQSPELKTEFVKGAEGIKVELIDYNRNPYKAMYVLATSCWGSSINKWAETSPENRFLVVKAVLERQALPLALEVPNFTFAVEGPSRAAFDQLARTRVGAVFSAKGMRDNNWKDASIRVPSSLWPSEEEFSLAEIEDPTYDTRKDAIIAAKDKVTRFNKIKETLSGNKAVYADIVDVGKGSWQAARSVLNLYVVYGYSVCYNYSSLRNVCANRMKFCEMEDVVATAWLMANEVSNVFPLLGSYLRPGCDFAHKCQYHKSYYLSELFGCLFKECGRNACDNDDGYAEFNETCTDVNVLENQTHLHITRPSEWIDYTWETLSERDKELFSE